MFTRFFSPLKSSNAGLFRNMFKFSTENKPSSRNIKETANKADLTNPSEAESNIAAPKNVYHYDVARFNQVNNETFIKKIEQMERAEKMGKKKADGYKIPIFLTLTAAFLYHLWVTCPYNVVYKHATVNEYIEKRNYFHAIFLSPLSFQTFSQFVIYFPLMIYSFVLMGKHIKQKHMALLYLTNCLISYATVYYVEKHQKGVKMMKPRPTGGVTPLCFISSLLVIDPTHAMLKTRMLPFFAIPLAYYLYEAIEFQQNQSEEISSEAHFASILYGFFTGFVFRTLIARGRI